MQSLATQSVILFSQRFDSYSSAVNAFKGVIPHDFTCSGRSFTVNQVKRVSEFSPFRASVIHQYGAQFVTDKTNQYVKKIAYQLKDKVLELAHEAAALEVLSDTGAVPLRIEVEFERGTSEICRLRTLVMEKVGERIVNLKSYRGTRALRKELVSTIGIAAINLLEKVHERGLVHGDVHEGNFVLDPSQPAQTLRIIDFGNARPYIDPTTGNHVAETGAPHHLQDPIYLSVFELQGSAVSRRDDLFRLAELLIFLVSDNRVISGVGRNELLDAKLNRRADQRVPVEFREFYMRTMKLGFDETPNYEKYRSLLTELATRPRK